MVEGNTEITNRFIRSLNEQIENLKREQAEKISKETEIVEELKIQVRPKLLIVNKALADVANIFKKHDEGGKLKFTKKLEFYLEGLTFDSNKVICWLDEEIIFLKSEMERMI